MKLGNRKIDLEDVACLSVIIIGGIFMIMHPDQINDIFWKIVGGIVLIRLFW